MEKILIKKIDEELFHEKLSNGLDVYMLINKRVNNFYITLTTKYGSLHTDFEIDGIKYKSPNGIAHFLEHVNFNEEDGHTAHEYFDKIGSAINAFTTFDFTSYEVMASSNFQDNLEHLLDYVQKPIFSNELIEKEKGIICEEVKMGKNNPGQLLYYSANKGLLKKDKRRIYVTGDIKDVKKTTKEDIELVYNSFYHPENMFLIITGNFDKDEALNIIKNNQNKKVFNKYKRPVIIKHKEPNTIPIEYQEIESNVELPKCKMSFKMDMDLFRDYDYTLLNTYLSIIMSLNFGSTSLLREELLDRELVNYISSSIDTSNDLVIISVIFEGKDVGKVIPIIKERMLNYQITEDDLKRKSRSSIAALINCYDDIEYVNTDIMDQLIYNNKIEDNYYDMLNNLNIKELNDIKDRLDFNNCSITVLKPFQDKYKRIF